MAETQETVDRSPRVLVVGAGPTGLLLAAELARRDVSCLLIDALDAPLGWDRATVLHERSLEIFEALGIAAPFLADGVRTRGARIHSEGAVVGELRLDLTRSRYGFQVGISEEVTESVLTEYLEAHGGAVTRSTRFVGLAAGEDSVETTLERDGERLEVTAQWVVGCDGHQSAVRAAAGIDFPGVDIDEPWAVFDATLKAWPDDYETVAVYLDQPPVIMTPLPHRRWRVYVRPSSEGADLVEESAYAVRRYVPELAFGGVENPTRFYCRSRVASRYRAGRVLIAGDAAHACTPAEGHGMNTGLQDAFNLGWKLALVCRGEAGADLLDTYEAERRPVAERIVDSGSATEAAQTMTDASDRVRRNEAMRVAFADPETARHDAAAASELDRSYPRSRVVAGHDGPGLIPGVLLPDTPPVRPADGQPCPLHKLAHSAGHTLLVLGGPQADPARVSALVADLERHRGPLVSAVHGLCTQPADGSVGQIDDATAEALGVSGVTVLAVRPDRYIGLRDDDGTTGAVDDYLAGLVA